MQKTAESETRAYETISTRRVVHVSNAAQAGERKRKSQLSTTAIVNQLRTACSGQSLVKSEEKRFS